MSRPFKMKGFPAHAGVSPMKKVNPDAKRVISTKGKVTKYTKGGRHGVGGAIEKARQTTYTKQDDGTYTKKVATAPKGATSDADLVTKREKTISTKKAERQIRRKTKKAERSSKRADIKRVKTKAKEAIKAGYDKKDIKTRKKATIKAIKNR
tara:strand:+ start:557 stop:1012 length:456 start_codon:yes stop_codon:yes gene_type:complete